MSVYLIFFGFCFTKNLYPLYFNLVENKLFKLPFGLCYLAYDAVDLQASLCLTATCQSILMLEALVYHG